MLTRHTTRYRAAALRRAPRRLRLGKKAITKDYKDIVLSDVKTLAEIIKNGLGAVEGVSNWAEDYDLPIGDLIAKIQQNLTEGAKGVAQAFKKLSTQPTTARTALALSNYPAYREAALGGATSSVAYAHRDTVLNMIRQISAFGDQLETLYYAMKDEGNKSPELYQAVSHLNKAAGLLDDVVNLSGMFG